MVLSFFSDLSCYSYRPLFLCHTDRAIFVCRSDRVLFMSVDRALFYVIPIERSDEGSFTYVQDDKLVSSR